MHNLYINPHWLLIAVAVFFLLEEEVEGGDKGQFDGGHDYETGRLAVTDQVATEIDAHGCQIA